MFAANFLDNLPQPDDTRNFQAVAPSSKPVTRAGRLFSLLKFHLIGARRPASFFLPALFDSGDYVSPHPVLDVVVACPEFGRRDEVQLLIRGRVVRRQHPVDFVDDEIGRA